VRVITLLSVGFRIKKIIIIIISGTVEATVPKMPFYSFITLIMFGNILT